MGESLLVSSQESAEPKVLGGYLIFVTEDFISVRVKQGVTACHSLRRDHRCCRFSAFEEERLRIAHKGYLTMVTYVVLFI
jgi:hypothetical protein